MLLPIPFTDLSSSKVRPAVVVGHGTYPGDLFVVPVTSQLSNADLPLNDWQAAGLNVPSGIKGQICTVEGRLVRKVVLPLLAYPFTCSVPPGPDHWQPPPSTTAVVRISLSA